MRRTLWSFSVLTLSLLVWSPYQAAADPWKDESGHGKYRYESEGGKQKYDNSDGDCKYERKWEHGEFKEEWKCEHGPAVAGYPMPSGGGHGPDYHEGAPALPPMAFDSGSGQCNRELLGRLLGAAAGGLLGAQVGDGRGQLAAVAGGTLLGFLVGGNIGRGMDALDQNCVGQALEHAQDGQQVAWQNPDNGTQYHVVPTRTVERADGRYCREYTATAVINGRSQETYGHACRQPDGSWQMVS